MPPEVNTISEAETFKNEAITFLDCSINALDERPKLCVDEALPKFNFITSVILSTTSLRIGVVAALSK